MGKARGAVASRKTLLLHLGWSTSVGRDIVKQLENLINIEKCEN